MLKLIANGLNGSHISWKRKDFQLFCWRKIFVKAKNLGKKSKEILKISNAQ